MSITTMGSMNPILLELRIIVCYNSLMKYIAYLTKGLEEAAELEIRKLISGILIDEVGDKRIVFQTDQDPKSLLNLKTVDDIGILIARLENVENLGQIAAIFDDFDLTDIKNFIQTIRDIEQDFFSLTVGIVSSPVKSSELITSLEKFISQKYNWDFVERDHSNFDIRIFIDHKQVYVSVRLTKESLYNRSYKKESNPGSLKPSIAAAMVLLATNDQQSLKMVDNFCGSGTILCEAQLTGNQVFGGDINPESVETTKRNLANLGYHYEERIKILDATKTNWSDNYFDLAISNLPWDKQIEISSVTDLYDRSIKEYVRILKPNGVICALVSKPELFIKWAKKYKTNAKIVSYRVGLLGQNPTIVLVS